MEKTILVIDACVRQEESRTRKLMDVAVTELKTQHPDWKWEILNLMEEDLKYWTTETLKERDRHLAAGEYDHPLFRYGNQFREADGIVVAAPFWDLSVPAVLKVYIENISAQGITFDCNENGLYGICHGAWMLFLTTRGAMWEGGDMEQGSPYMEALSKFFGIDQYHYVYADGLDIQGLDHAAIMEDAIEQTKEICSRLS